ncbi:uncharacterized protein NEMAJ01_1738 [Nematocida major]|uniref:uncharacterized protein n=1 Tax=Nematocida major TaxID=1912982 RepID=UPI0020089614|nr:uncharacterized protein NEMAJ01_1738 [Nematocida major]KAH9386842.1 hypothetical protein NEMAJ01_1738 [Nematocida major]
MRSIFRRFSFARSAREFVGYLSDELFTAGQGAETQIYYTIMADPVRTEIKQPERPHSPLVEMMFMCLLCILCTMIFKCAIHSMKPIVFDVSGGNACANIGMGVISALLVVLQFRKIYKPEPV